MTKLSVKDRAISAIAQDRLEHITHVIAEKVDAIMREEEWERDINTFYNSHRRICNMF